MIDTLPLAAARHPGDYIEELYSVALNVVVVVVVVVIVLVVIICIMAVINAPLALVALPTERRSRKMMKPSGSIIAISLSLSPSPLFYSAQKKRGEKKEERKNDVVVGGGGRRPSNSLF